MASKFKEYDRGRSHGLQLAMRIMQEEGNEEGYKRLKKEVWDRGLMVLNTNLTLKEMDSGLEQMKKCMYETFLCQTLMVLHDEFGFGRQRCERFMQRWKLKTDSMAGGLVCWGDYVQCIKDELGIDVPTTAIIENELMPET